jgi:hypothetical protein
MRFAFAALTLTLGCAPQDDRAAQTGTFEALTYNVHGLPEGITGDDTAGRIAEIAPLLSAYDVIGVQEAWRAPDLEVLAAGAPSATAITYAEPKDDSRAYGTGLAVFSSFSNGGTYTEHFADCFGTIDAASDCLASKGILAARLLIDSGLIDVYSIHLEAGSSTSDADARTTQVEQIVAAMNTWSAGNAVIFLGDTNVDEGADHERPQLERLLTGAGLTDACAATSCPEPDHIDRVLFRSGDTMAVEATSWAIAEEFIDGSGVPLSDHPAIRVGFAWVSAHGATDEP